MSTPTERPDVHQTALLRRGGCDGWRHGGLHTVGITRGQILAQLATTRDYSEIDWTSAVSRITALAEEKRRLEESSEDLDRITRGDL
ncbi:hypothetical protein AB0D37_43540 [Streptomyces sp. NPDC048384]|uniref:hypothetical protein n=1 Tax=Streptomyces sp. NPDC048384 TaxID=3155487 RepID=UPI003419C970